MIDTLLQIGFSNTCTALLLGVVAVVVGTRANRPQLVHMLWLLVFIKLVTPPLMNIPVLPDLATDASRFSVATGAIVAQISITGADPVSAVLSYLVSTGSLVKPWLATVWILGSLVALAWSLLRVVRFNRLLDASSRPASAEVRRVTAGIAERLGLTATQDIRTTTAALSPMVWWTGGRVRVIMPEAFLAEMEVDQWKWVLAHELAHIRRRDHVVRWVEWLARICFWWNPVVWWAQRNLRAAEEICCDALVVRSLAPGRSTYAASLLAAMASLADPIQRPPLMASEVNSGGQLERRFEVIVSGDSTLVSSRLLPACVLLCAVTVLPLGLVRAQNDRSDVENYLDGVWTELQQAVAAGSLTQEEARAKMAKIKERARKRMEYVAMHERIQAAVEAGEISEAEARERIEGIKRRWASGAERGEEQVRKERSGSMSVEEYRAAEKRIRKLVEEGKVPAELAEIRLRDLRALVSE